jgi:hypothetical protein
MRWKRSPEDPNKKYQIQAHNQNVANKVHHLLHGEGPAPKPVRWEDLRDEAERPAKEAAQREAGKQAEKDAWAESRRLESEMKELGKKMAKREMEIAKEQALAMQKKVTDMMKQRGLDPSDSRERNKFVAKARRKGWLA